MARIFQNPQLTRHGALKHLLSIEGLAQSTLIQLLDTANQFVSLSENEREVKKVPLLRGKSVFNLFFENSTRTRTTFEIAAKKTRKEHKPALIHITEITQPQGHSTSGSHERYKSKERLDWEKDFCCLLKFRKWIISQNS